MNLEEELSELTWDYTYVPASMCEGLKVGYVWAEVESGKIRCSIEGPVDKVLPIIRQINEQ